MRISHLRQPLFDLSDFVIFAAETAACDREHDGDADQSEQGEREVQIQNARWTGKRGKARRKDEGKTERENRRQCHKQNDPSLHLLSPFRSSVLAFFGDIMARKYERKMNKLLFYEK